MENYRLEGKTFVIDDYDRLPAFSSFLPGLAGVKGIPMWTFYTLSLIHISEPTRP